jgi:predicted RNA-binding protein YlqC (UPF0109 family)
VTEIHDEYVEGDINTIDGDDDDFDDETTSAVERASTARNVLHYVATALADDPGAVSVTASDQGSKVLLSLNVGAEDMGRVIGRRGRTAQALRTLVGAAGARDGVVTSVDIVD